MGQVGVAPPVAVILACCQVWLAFYSAVLLQSCMMASLYLSGLVFALLGGVLYQVTIPKLDDALVHKVLYGDNVKEAPQYAHRGAGHDAPENTLAAFRQAKANGAFGVEFDIGFTRDNIAVLLHDDTVDRTTNGSGKLSDLTFVELRELDASAKHPFHERYKGEKVPTLEEGIQECLALGLRMMFDVKEYDSRAIVVIQEMFSKYKDLYKTALVASFYPHFIYQLRSADANIATALTWRPHFVTYDEIVDGRPRYRSLWQHVLAQLGDVALEWSIHNWLWYMTGVSAVLIHKDCLSMEYVRMWRTRDIHVVAWTANHVAEKDYLSKTLGVLYMTDTLQKV